MTTLQDALKRALEKDANEWDQDQQRIDKEKKMKAYTFENTKSASKATFYFIKNNPGLTKRAVAEALATKGFNLHTIITITNILIRLKRVQLNGEHLVALADSFEPLASPRKKKVVIVRRPTVEKPTQQHVDTKWNVKELLGTLSIVQAKQLYTELKEIFSN